MTATLRSKFVLLARTFALLALVVASFASPQPAHAAALCFVDADAVGLNNGTSWLNAYTSLQSALGSCSEIWVAEGEYKPGALESATFNIPPLAAVYGGFAGTETLRSQRSPASNITVLSGDIDDNDATDGNGIVLDYSNISGNNSDHVITINGTAGVVVSTTVLDGFVITGGQADGSSPADSGGGLFCNGSGTGSACSPTLSNLIFRGNQADYLGGGVLNDGSNGGSSSPSFTNVTFIGDAADFGGAVTNSGLSSGTSSPVFTNTTFWGNVASYGGAMSIEGYSAIASPVLRNVTFSNNFASSAGGAMWIFSYVGIPLLTNVILWGDSAGAGASEIANSSGGIPVISYSVVEGGCASIVGASCGSGNRSTDPVLGALATNGGFTQTLALLPGSSAINGGDDATCAAAPVNGVDQRGVTRPLGAHCDIGVFEAAPPTTHDYDADGSMDPAVFEKATGNWFVVGSTDGFSTPALGFGNDPGYIPVPGDYDGDGKTDAAVFEKPTGNWFVVSANAGFFTPALGFGNAGSYIPVPGDYDGDGSADAAVFEKTTGNWFVVGSTDGFFTPALGFGNNTSYRPVPGDYDGDGQTDAAVFENATGNWFVVGSTSGFFTPALGFGNSTSYIPVPGDYDGDGSTDPAVFEKATGNWFVVGSTAGFFTPALGFGNDTSYRPQPADYDGDGSTDPAVFERATGNWFVVGSTAGFFTPALGFGNDTLYLAVVKP